MIFKGITLENFGIFYGRQELALTPGLYVIHGPNGRGKTTLQNAIKWALFGTYLTRQGRDVSPDVILNRDAAREGETRYSVTLDIDDGGTSYLVRRSYEVGKDAPPSLYVERDGSPLDQQEAEIQVANLLHRRVADFFLFDGEQLREYEDRLMDEDSAALVKSSIERILGLPVLDNALSDLKALEDELGKRQAKLARQDAKVERLGLTAEQLEKEISDAEEDLAGLQAQLDDAQGIITEKDQYLQKYQSSLESIKSIEALTSELEQIEREREDLVGMRAIQLAGAWRDVLAVAVKDRKAGLEAELREQEDRRAEHIRRAGETDLIQRSLDDNECVICAAPITEERGEQLRTRLQQDSAGENGASGGDGSTAQRLLALSGIAAAGAIEQAGDVDRRISSLNSREAAREQELAQLREAIQSLPETEVNRAIKARDEAMLAVGRIRGSIEAAEGELETRREQLRRTREEIAAGGTSGELQEIGGQLACARELATLFEAARGRYRDQLRERVEADASEIFRELTNEPESYTGLRINDSYGLEMLNAGGEVVGGISAGQAQVVALALVGALNRNATRKAPVVMDTPFGRLDPVHRKNILGFLARLAEQVFLLVHGGEVKDEDLAKIAADITAQEDLHRDGPDRTSLIPRTS